MKQLSQTDETTKQMKMYLNNLLLLQFQKMEIWKMP